ncbi:MAG: hypothetical protein ABI867_06635 [Kofleriaceae bacterium]
MATRLLAASKKAAKVAAARVAVKPPIKEATPTAPEPEPPTPAAPVTVAVADPAPAVVDASTSIAATNPPSESGLVFAVAFGFLEDFVLSGPGHTFYSYAGMTVASTHGKLTIVPELLIEYAPGAERWGTIVGATLDLNLTSRFGVDAIVEVGNDLSGANFGDAFYFVGFGLGATIYQGHWTVTPFAVLYKGLNYAGWDIAPGVNIAYAL